MISSFRGRDRKAERDAKRNASLSARSNQSPVIAQRPIAPIQPIESEEAKPRPMEMVSVTDSGIETVTIDEETNEISTPVSQELSIETNGLWCPCCKEIYRDFTIRLLISSFMQIMRCK
jgi:hypothetical protein